MDSEGLYRCQFVLQSMETPIADTTAVCLGPGNYIGRIPILNESEALIRIFNVLVPTLLLGLPMIDKAKGMLSFQLSTDMLLLCIELGFLATDTAAAV